MCPFLYCAQTEASLARAHERIKELEVGLTVFVGKEGGGMGGDRVVIWERGKGVYVCKYVCVHVHHTYVRTVAVTFLVNMQTCTLAPRINPQYTSVPPNPPSTGGAGAKLPAGGPAERSASCAPSVMQAPSARRDGRLAS